MPPFASDSSFSRAMVRRGRWPSGESRLACFHFLGVAFSSVVQFMWPPWVRVGGFNKGRHNCLTKLSDNFVRR